MTKGQRHKREAQWRRFHAWERKFARRVHFTRKEALRIFDELYREARKFGAFQKSESVDLRPKLRIAAILNSSDK